MAPRTRNSIDNSVLPQPAPPQRAAVEVDHPDCARAIEQDVVGVEVGMAGAEIVEAAQAAAEATGMPPGFAWPGCWLTAATLPALWRWPR